MENMNSPDLSRTILIRIGGITTGINRKEMGLTQVISSNNTAFLAKRKNNGSYLMATADFRPTILENSWIKDLRVAILFLPIMNEGYDPKQLMKFYPLPDWISMADNIEFLDLHQVLVGSLKSINGDHLNFLILNQIEFEDRAMFFFELERFHSLKYLVHDSIFTPSEVADMKARTPNLSVLTLNEYEEGFRSGIFKYP